MPGDDRTATVPTLLRCCAALAATPGRLLRPRKPDTALLAALRIADPPPARATVALTVLTQATMHAPTTIVAEGTRELGRMTLVMGSFLVEHPKARFLIDPALCSGVHERVLPELPFPVPLLVAPERPVLGLADALAARDVAVDSIEFVLPTHLHWDHVSGLLELPDRVPVRLPAVERDWALAGPRAPIGVARGPLRNRTTEPLELDGPPVFGFPRSHDLFGDGSVLLLDLHGHTPGSVGVLLAVDDGTRVLLAGDAVWSKLQVDTLREKAPMPGRLFDADRDAAFATIHRLHALPDGIELIAAHDHAAVTARAARNPRR
ncbi:MBL fold metallo-hydrolase [Nocardia asteroides]|uniref:MBL fold metallo-hydrolase n=1 Tax=Nocardia asteroides TaxID=1824 RepID=UPI001E58FFDC|nr:MBL fold metallo-hydrolase [Nocardia asteroides]UGT59221.1 MBL fold metallo-hydrolase [Nocardia asteroides]